MLITKVAETINLDNGQQITERIFLDITNINFSLKDDQIGAFIKMGYEVTELIPMTDGETQIVERVISHKPKNFNDARLKELLDANGIVFNSDASNFLLREMITNAIPILQSVITLDPQEYFGLTIDKWEVANV
jgi:hypothetical protein